MTADLDPERHRRAPTVTTRGVAVKEGGTSSTALVGPGPRVVLWNGMAVADERTGGEVDDGDDGDDGLPPWVGYIIPAILAVVFVLAAVGLLNGLSTAGSWTSTFAERGRFVVADCDEEPLRLGSRVTCAGEFIPEAAVDGQPATMVGPGAAFGAAAPVAGERIDVYHEAGDVSIVYPEDGRPTELARLLLGTLDGLFLVIGSGVWLAGWGLTRHISAEDAELRPYRYRFPQRFGLRRRANRWLIVGFGLWALDRWWLEDLLGTAGVL